jgi:uncharacterized protein
MPLMVARVLALAAALPLSLIGQAGQSPTPTVSKPSTPEPPGQTGETNQLARHFAEDFPKLRARAEQGDAVAQNLVGEVYGAGRWMKADPKEALQWYSRSAKKGHAPGQYNLAVALENGEGTPVDLREALQWYKKAAAQGFAPAQYNLGLLLLRGQINKPKPSEGAKWILKAANQNDRLAQVALASLYAEGNGVHKDPVEAWAWLSVVLADDKFHFQTESLVSSRSQLQQLLTPSQLEAARTRLEVLRKQLSKGSETGR